jgi:hypothetical protein
MTGATVTIDYTNWRGERAIRRVKPVRIRFGSNEWHREPQWLLYAVDVEKRALRAFALCSIHSWSSDPSNRDVRDYEHG